MITEDYVSYEIAKLLKDKGFNEYCFAAYSTEIGDFITVGPIKNSEIDADNTHICTAPTHQMAMKWLRKIHNIILDTAPNIDGDFNCIGSFCCLVYKEGFLITTLSDGDSTYEEAVEAALKYCLTNLI